MRLFTLLPVVALLALLALLAVAPTALAQSAHAGHDHHAGHAKPTTPAPTSKHAAAFKQLDRDNDGFIRRSDLPADHPLLPHLEMSDRNRDGKLDAKEFETGMNML